MSVVPVEVCRACGKVYPKLSMSKVDDTLCVRCSSKLVLKAQLDDGQWLEDGLSLGIKHWEQFPNEPRGAYQAFVVFRNAYPKMLSTKEISEATGIGTSGILHWMKRWRWKERFFEWSRKCDNEALEQQKEIRKEMNDRQIRTSQKLLKMAMDRLDKIDIDELEPKTVLAFAELAAKMERAAVADNRTIVEHTLETKQIHIGTDKKAEASIEGTGLEEVLNILAGAGAININTNTTITTPRVVVEENDDAFEEINDAEYQSFCDVVEEGAKDESDKS